MGSRMKKVVSFLILFSYFGFVFTQQVDNQCIEIKTVRGDLLSADANGDVFVADGPTLYKLGPDGRVLFQYCDFLLGDIFSIDVDNPLKIMVFYDVQGKIVFLDEKLVPIAETLDLSAKGFHSIAFATYSTDNTIWLYDAVSQDIVNVDFQLKELSRNHLMMDGLAPVQFFSLQEKQLVMNNSGRSVLLFDAFGTYLKTVPIASGKHKVCVKSNRIFYWNPSQDGVGNDGWRLNAYDYKLLDNQYVVTIPKDFRDFAVTKSHIYYLDLERRLNRVDL